MATLKRVEWRGRAGSAMGAVPIVGNRRLGQTNSNKQQ
jgi:hypothetical protein